MTALPSLSVAADSCDARLPGEYVFWSDPPRNGVLRDEFDCDRVLLAMQRAETARILADMRRDRPHMRSVHELCALADALLNRWYGGLS